MGRVKFITTALSSLKCPDRLPSSCVTLKQQAVMFCESANRQAFPVTSGEIHKRSSHIKIGNKVYVVKSGKDEILLKGKKNMNHLFEGARKASEDECKQDNASTKLTDDMFKPSEGTQDANECPKDILKQSFTNKVKIKPFLTANDPKLTLINKFTPNNYPSASDILNFTRPAVHARNSVLRYDAAVRKLGSDAFIHYHESTLQGYSDFRNLVVEYLKTGDDTLSVVSPVVEAYWESLKPVLRDITYPQHIHANVSHPYLRYNGNIDCIAHYKSTPVLIDWQVVTKRREILRKEDPLMLVACGGALNFDPQWSHQVNSCLVVFVNVDGSPAKVFLLKLPEIQVFWKSWLRRLDEFWQNRYAELKKEDDIRMSVQKEYTYIQNTTLHNASEDSLRSPISDRKVPIHEDVELPNKAYFKNVELESSVSYNSQEKMHLIPMAESRQKVQNIVEVGSPEDHSERIEKPNDKAGAEPEKKEGLLEYLKRFWK